MSRARMAALLVIVATVALVVFAVTRGGDPGRVDDGTGDRQRAEAWSQEAADAYRPLGRAAIELPGRARAWLEGTRSQEQFRADVDEALAAATEVRSAVAELRPFPLDRRVTPLYRSSTELYVQHVRAYEQALATPAGDDRVQLDLMARRMRVLADRVFDRGQALVKPHVPDPVSPDVIVNLPEEVPNWAAEALAAGPPLAPPPPPPATTPQLRQDHRPVQPRDAWLAAVHDASPPPAATAEQYEAAAERLRTVPDPDGPGGREESARVRLGLLVQAEAARATRAAVILNVPALADIAGAVARAGEPLRVS